MGEMLIISKVFTILFLLCLWKQGIPWQFSQQISKTKKKVVLFPEIGRWKFFHHSPARIVACVLEYTFLISKNNKQTTKKHKNQKKQKKLKMKREYLQKID